jgi:hypothetical protein
MFSVTYTPVHDLLEGTKQANKDNRARLSKYMLGNTSNSGNAIQNSIIQMRKQLEDYGVYFYALPKSVTASADHWQFHGKHGNEYRLFTGVTSKEKIFHCPITGADHKHIVYTASWYSLARMGTTTSHSKCLILKPNYQARERRTQT